MKWRFNLNLLRFSDMPTQILCFYKRKFCIKCWISVSCDTSVDRGNVSDRESVNIVTILFRLIEQQRKLSLEAGNLQSAFNTCVVCSVSRMAIMSHTQRFYRRLSLYISGTLSQSFFILIFVKNIGEYSLHKLQIKNMQTDKKIMQMYFVLIFVPAAQYIVVIDYIPRSIYKEYISPNQTFLC